MTQHLGVYDREGKGRSRMTRIRATDKLIKIIEDMFKITEEMIEIISSAESVILREYDAEKGKKVDIQYEEDDVKHQMRNDLRAYNNLLHKTYINIPLLEGSKVPMEDDRYVYVSQLET